MTPSVAGFALLKDLPTFLATFPKEVERATVAGHKESLLIWRDRTENPGLAFRFTWAFSKGGRTTMRRRKYGSPTLLRLNYAKQGLGMPSEARPGIGSKHVRLGARRAPNTDKPWFVTTGGTRAKILARRPISRLYGGQIVTRMKAGGLGINLLGGQNMRGVASSAWVHVPISYQMRVYKDSVHRTGAYTVTVTRAIPRWVHTYVGRTYKQEFEDLSEDLPWIRNLAEQAIRRNLRDLVIDDRGRVRLRYRKALNAGKISASELTTIEGG